MKFLRGKKEAVDSGEFGYLDAEAVYFDSACQSLRPQPVIDALTEYYKEFNSCGERVKYAWGRKVDERIEDTRGAVLKLLKMSPRKYFVSFTLNTTYGVNLVLSQLKEGVVKKVVTTDIEHNSVGLATIAFAKKHGVEREVIARKDDGSIDLKKANFKDALVVVNAVSNIDGRVLKNLHEVVDRVRKGGGVVVLDAAQAMAHSRGVIERCEADVVVFSAHKMYAPSLGVMVVGRGLLEKIDLGFVGGGMVDDAWEDDYKLSYTNDEHIHTVFEPGLQAFGEIVALGEAIRWLKKTEKTQVVELKRLSKKLFDFLKSKKGVVLVNKEANAVISFYHKKIDGHLLAAGMSSKGIMARSGYFCCHYYLDHVKKYPPLVRFSLGYHTREEDVDRAIEALEKVLN
ncbi:aminotransferase class V-fold PLP-dependent enzyme [Candidatus Saccharibacteria bacterium]|nr:aminotransferase class V-fold PLP-dependent enzyme [Candidatus Saccharibacteria bacterium]